MEILYSGFDTIYFAVQGALNPQKEKLLASYKELAIERDEPVLIESDSEELKYMLSQNGRKGGYAYVIDTGHTGEKICVKKTLSRTEWNGFVEIKSAALLSHGWGLAVENALNSLKGIGFHIVNISLNRVDYCIDFLNPNIKLDAKDFVAHSRVTKTEHFGTKKAYDPIKKTSVTRSNRVESVTLGKMPGRQIIVYDKRAEIIASRKTYWFEAWGLNRDDPANEIFRVEIRAGKKELTNRNVSSLDDFKSSIGLVLLAATKAIRYVKFSPNDKNISRAPLHPLWEAVQGDLKTALGDKQTPLQPPQILTHMKRHKALEYRANIIGNAGGFLACTDTLPDDITVTFNKEINPIIDAAQNESTHRLWKNYNRTKDKWH